MQRAREAWLGYLVPTARLEEAMAIGWDGTAPPPPAPLVALCARCAQPTLTHTLALTLTLSLTLSLILTLPLPLTLP